MEWIQDGGGREPNEGEEKVMEFLNGLPAGYYGIREACLAGTYVQSLPLDERDQHHKRPDFLVIGPEVGLVSIEAKKWRITGQQYVFISQQRVVKRSPTGHEETLKNPVWQAYEYWQWLKDIAGKEGLQGVPVSSICSFPTLGRSEFLNGVQDFGLFNNPQSKFILEPSSILFKDDTFHAKPLEWLRDVAHGLNRYHATVDDGACEQLVQALVPTVTVGGTVRRAQERKEFDRLSREQWEWATAELDVDQNYLLDVAGSGKTSVLLSKAMHFVDRQAPRACRVLVTTYSPDLTRNLRHTLRRKATAGNVKGYESAIEIRSVQDVLRQVAERLGVEVPGDLGGPEDGGLAELVSDALFNTVEVEGSAKEDFHLFDAVFVDEVQDFGNAALVALQYLCNSDRFFFVGDASQRLYERFPELDSIGIQIRSAQLEPTYRMYRTPRWVSRLATRFIWSDAGTRQTLLEQGYVEGCEAHSPIDNAAVFFPADTPEEAMRELVVKLKGLRGHVDPEDVLVISSEERLPQLQRMLEDKKVTYHLGEPETPQRAVVVSTFMTVKGLERPHVYVVGIEDLFHSSKAGLFIGVDERAELESHARRQLYVALTRTSEELSLHYWDVGNPYVAQLQRIQSELDGERTRVKT